MTEIIPPEKTEPYQPHSPPLLNAAQPIPGFLTQAAEYIRLHPEAIRVIAPNELQQLGKTLDELPMGLGEIIKSKYPVLRLLLDGVSTPQTAIGEQEEDEERHGVTAREWKRILARIVELDTEGFQPKRIGDMVYDEFDVDLYPTQIESALDRYYSRVSVRPVEAPGRENAGNLSESQKAKVKSILSENLQLKQEIAKYQQKGLIRRVAKLLW